MKDLWIKRFKRKALPVLISITNVPFIKRMPMVLKKAPFERHVDYICYTPGEFNRMRYESSILMDVLENGERVVI